MVSTILSFLQQTVTVITRRCNQHTHVRGILFATETLSAKQVSICDGLLFLRILFWKYLSGLEINTIVCHAGLLYTVCITVDSTCRQVKLFFLLLTVGVPSVRVCTNACM